LRVKCRSMSFMAYYFRLLHLTEDLEVKIKQANEQFSKMKVVELKALCKERKLAVTGKKADLIERLCDYYREAEVGKMANGVYGSSVTGYSEARNLISDGLDAMSLKDLKDACIARGIPGSGTKKQIIERMRQDIQMTKDLQEVEQPEGPDGYIALSELLEKVALEKSSASSLSRFVTLKITSLGLQPEKFTTGGAPSVTSDVIRSLAGDPFSEPPKYGKVSGI
jgi:predicted HAD superfamily phosphohydrolase